MNISNINSSNSQQTPNITHPNLNLNKHSQTHQSIQHPQLQIDDIFQVMQQNFNSTFNHNINQQPQKISTQHISTQTSKQILPTSSRSSRKIKPIFNSITKNNQSDKSQQKSLQIVSSNVNNLPSKQISNNKSKPAQKNNKELSNQIEQNVVSNNSSPYGKIIGKINHSHTNQFDSDQYNKRQNNNTVHKQLNQHEQNNQKIGEEINSQVIKSPKILNYQDLQQKIQSALKKSSHYKAFGSASSRLSKSNFTTRSFNQFNQMLLTRFDEYQKKKQRQIQHKKQQLEQRKQKQLKFHPQINKKSIKFLEQMGGHQPIEHRYQKIIQAKNKKMQQHQEQKRQKQQEEYEQYRQQFMKYQKSSQQNTRSYDQFYEQMRRWKQRSRKNAQQKKKLIEQKQIEQNNHYQPKINKKSEKIVMKSMIMRSQKHLPIYERQIPSQKRFKCKIDEECTFKPKINKRKVK